MGTSREEQRPFRRPVTRMKKTSSGGQASTGRRRFPGDAAYNIIL